MKIESIKQLEAVQFTEQQVGHTRRLSRSSQKGRSARLHSEELRKVKK